MSSHLLFSLISRTGSLIVGESGRKNRQKVPWASVQSFRKCLWLRRHASGLLRALWALDATHSSLRNAMRCHRNHCTQLRSWPLRRLGQHRITWRSPFSPLLLAPLGHSCICSSLFLHPVHLMSQKPSVYHIIKLIYHFLVHWKDSLRSS